MLYPLAQVIRMSFFQVTLQKELWVGLEAWGAHLHFSPLLPEAAIEAGADLVNSSIHKVLGSLGQSAILHLGQGEMIDGAGVDRAITLLESSAKNWFDWFESFVVKGNSEDKKEKNGSIARCSFSLATGSTNALDKGLF